ncbi:MAG: hypothetical protein FWB88_09380 [Defluviitaleaceae bacterium]|nr:hypothetical protein [Defluviitaleaceae bacterium]MCL2239999.1 hypothetical protein [Defluviitaleaceae bacterium]
MEKNVYNAYTYGIMNNRLFVGSAEMTKKASTLEDVYNRFRPSPLTLEEKHFYQETAEIRNGRSYEMHASLFNRIRIGEKKRHVHQLMIGHTGCGKSTELYMLTEKLQEVQTPYIIINAKEDLDFFTFTYIDIMINIVERLAVYADENNISINENLLESFQAALSTKTTEQIVTTESKAGIAAEAKAGVSFLGIFKSALKLNASFKAGSDMKETLRHELKPHMLTIATAVNELLKEINKDKPIVNNMVIIIDELEKCRAEAVRKLFVDDIMSITSIATHLIISCPLNLFRSSDAAIFVNHFSKPDVMPMIKTHEIMQDCPKKNKPYDEGITIVEKLVLKRVDESFFEEGVLGYIITKSGGNLRDVSYIIENSAFEALMNNKEKIDMMSVDTVVKDFASERYLRIDMKRSKNILRTLYYHENHSPENDKDLTELLFVGAVFEYNGDRWVDLHPMIRDYLTKHESVLKNGNE